MKKVTRISSDNRWLSSRSYYVLAALAVLMVLAGVAGLIHHLSSSGSTNLPNPSAVVTISSSNPSEAKPNDIAEYKVAPDQPKQILINSIGSQGLIQKVGLDKQGSVAVPGNINFAGWYVYSVRPGDDGLSLIDGHVGGKYNGGIFKQLGKLQKGDSFVIEFGDNSVRDFEVVETDQLSVAKAQAEFNTKRQDISNQLNLITCGGKYNSSTQQFADRIVVISKLI